MNMLVEQDFPFITLEMHANTSIVDTIVLNKFTSGESTLRLIKAYAYDQPNKKAIEISPLTVNYL